ncbi:DUF7096 domain-containing protein [Halosegnis marinus]|uniref:DUF7096 domain-containing protein n=1 Tax=Halosegnis marinus TaxID=3034023 RepID=UPI003622FCD9
MLGPPRPSADTAGEVGALRLVALALALCVLLASTAAALPLAAAPTDAADAVAPVQPVEPADNTTARLVLPAGDDRTSDFYTARLDVAGSTAAQTARIHGRYVTVELREEFAAAETDEERRRVVETTATEIDERLTELESRQETALSSYVAGDLSAGGLLRELVAVHTAARALETTVNQLYTYDRAVGTPVPPTEIARLKSRIIPLQGPVRDRVASALRTEGESARVYVVASGNGLVLSTVAEGDFSTQYVREALYRDGFDDSFSDRPITLDTFRDRMEELYPWVFGTDPPTDTVLTSEPYYLNAGVYGIAINHPQGTVSDRDLVVYYDASTDEVFYEVQRQDVSTLPTRVLANATDDGLLLTLRGPTRTARSPSRCGTRPPASAWTRR